MLIKRVLLAFPEFPTQYVDGSLKLNAKNGVQPPLGLLTVAACLPKEWEVRLVDCSAEALSPKTVEWADIVMSGGMSVQRKSTIDILRFAKSLGKTTVAGGVDTFDAPHWYQEFDHVIQGEAEVALPVLVEDWAKGIAKHLYDYRYTRADVTKSPVPRYDLIQLKEYMYPALQFVRGCPFQCEFCCVPEYGGRVPRYKTPEQIREELEVLQKTGYRGRVQLNDDNLIGNQEVCKKILKEVVEFQKKHDYPFWFGCWATMNLCDSPELLALFRDAGIKTVFFGIEAVDATVLKGHLKQHNLRFMSPKAIHKVFEHGIRITAGIIFGEDREEEGHDKRLFQFLQEAGIPAINANFLEATPGTALFNRLKKENRLLFDSSQYLEVIPSSDELNFITKRDRKEIFKEYDWFSQSIYTPRNYFARINLMLKHFSTHSHYKNTPEEKTNFSKALQLKAKKIRGFVHALLKQPRFTFHFALSAIHWGIVDRQKFLILLECSFEGVLRFTKTQEYFKQRQEFIASPFFQEMQQSNL